LKKGGEESPDSIGKKYFQGQRVTPAKSNLRESATETILPRKSALGERGENVKSSLMPVVLEIIGYKLRLPVTAVRGKPCPEQEQTLPPNAAE
jgi:hypothetical protein